MSYCSYYKSWLLNIIISFYSWGKWGIKTWSAFPRVTRRVKWANWDLRRVCLFLSTTFHQVLPLQMVTELWLDPVLWALSLVLFPLHFKDSLGAQLLGRRGVQDSSQSLERSTLSLTTTVWPCFWGIFFFFLASGVSLYRYLWFSNGSFGCQTNSLYLWFSAMLLRCTVWGNEFSCARILW